MRQAASLHLDSAASEPWRLARFMGAIAAYEEMGYRVTIIEWRDGSDKLYGLMAQATPILKKE